MITFVLTETTNLKEFEKTVEQEMDKPIKHFERELVAIRTNRAHSSMVEDIKITCYGGTVLSLRELAAISAPDARLIVIQPWDKGTIKDIEKGLMNSDLGITPLSDGETIKLQLPEMSSSRREELVKVLNKKAEECKVAVRNVRRDFHTFIKDTEKKKRISEDFSVRLTELLQKITDKFIAQADTLTAKKEKEIKAV